VPELPDLEVYVDRLLALAGNQPLRRVRLLHPFLLRTATPPMAQAEGRRLVGVRRLGKRIVLALDGGLFLVMHLMIAGRLQWRAGGAALPPRITLAVFEFDTGWLLLTEAGKTRRASLHVVDGEPALAAHDPGGIEPLAATLPDFADRLRRGNHTLKRALTDPATVAGIGNAYSDEILHRARLSPLALTGSLDDAAVARLHKATQAVLAEWRSRLAAEAPVWPAKVTAFHPAMAVHGRAGQPCPDCGAPVQRIVYATNECNYCARCQTGGRVLADRVLSRLLKDSFPRALADDG
jgi:formamidopyrimidine-DNA glycosylase